MTLLVQDKVTLQCMLGSEQIHCQVSEAPDGHNNHCALLDRHRWRLISTCLCRQANA